MGGLTLTVFNLTPWFTNRMGILWFLYGHYNKVTIIHQGLTLRAPRLWIADLAVCGCGLHN